MKERNIVFGCLTFDPAVRVSESYEEMRKIGIDDPNALSPLPVFGGLPPPTGSASAASTTLSSVGTGGELSRRDFSKEKKKHFFHIKALRFLPPLRLVTVLLVLFSRLVISV